VYGVNYYYTNFPQGFTDPYNPDRVYKAGSFNSAMFYTWIGNGYAWQFFLIPICVSIGAMLLCGCVNWLVKRFAKKQPAVPGFVAAATHPGMFPDVPAAVHDEESKVDETNSNSSGELGAKVSPEIDAPLDNPASVEGAVV